MREISPLSFVHRFLHQFHTSWLKEFSKTLIGQSQMTSKWWHVLPISVKNKGVVGVIVTSTVLNIEPIGFQQNMEMFYDHFFHSWRKSDQKHISHRSNSKFSAWPFVTLWPWMTFIWHKVTNGLGGYWYPRHDQCRSIGFISFWYGCLARRSQQWQIIQNLTFDLTCDVIGDAQIKFCTIFGKFNLDAIKIPFSDRESVQKFGR